MELGIQKACLKKDTNPWWNGVILGRKGSLRARIPHSQKFRTNWFLAISFYNDNCFRFYDFPFFQFGVSFSIFFAPKWNFRRSAWFLVSQHMFCRWVRDCSSRRSHVLGLPFFWTYQTRDVLEGPVRDFQSKWPWQATPKRVWSRKMAPLCQSALADHFIWPWVKRVTQKPYW